MGRLLRGLPRFRGKARIGQMLLGENAKKQPATVQDIDGNLFELPNLQEPVSFFLWLDGAYEPALRSYLQSVCRPGTTFVDVGANVGTFAIAVARCVAPGGHVLAIEASDAMAGVLRRNISLNRIENATVCECAASDGSRDTVAFFDAPPSKFGMGSRAPLFHSRPRTVPAASIDALLQRHACPVVSAIKVD